MNSVTVFLGTFSHLLQGQLFPILTEELGPLGERHQALVRALALLQLDGAVTRRQVAAGGLTIGPTWRGPFWRE